MRILFLSFLFSLTLYSAGNNWNQTASFSLKKDQVALWLVGDRELTFRWTLFHNRGLVYIAKFDKFPYQGILYKDYRLNGVKIALSVNNKTNLEDPYCMIVFESYDEKSKTAQFTLYVKDLLGTNGVLKQF